MADPKQDARQIQEARQRESELFQAEMARLYEEAEALRNSAIFRLREKLLPAGSWRQRLFKGLRSGAGIASATAEEFTYADWLRSYDTLSDEDSGRIRTALAAFTNAPRFSIVLAGRPNSAKSIEASIQSVAGQLYENWELWVSKDLLEAPESNANLAKWTQRESRIRVFDGSRKDALPSATGEYLAFIDPGGILAPHALYTVAESLVRHQRVALVYSDEDSLDGANLRSAPSFKPDWDPLLLLSFNYLGQLSAYRTDVVRKIGGMREENGDECAWDFVLRFSEAVDDDEIVHIPLILYHASAGTGERSDCGVRAIEDAMRRRGEEAEVEYDEVAGAVHVYFALPAPPPRVSVIIPTRDRVDLLSTCLNSLSAKTDYPDYEVIIVDNGSVEARSKAFFEELSSSGRARVLRMDAPFNFSELNNRAVEIASGEILAFLNNDLEIVDPKWMSRLAALAARPGIGAVGARLLYPDGAVQHAGVVLGFQKQAIHDFGYSGPRDFGHRSRALVDRSISAVTGACLFVGRSRFESVGGFDEDFPVTFNDFDLCLKLAECGLRNVYAGTVACVHHESASRGKDLSPAKRARSAVESIRFRARWWDKLQNDPYYNPNLCLDVAPHNLAREPRVRRSWRT
jgi:GT2 family glycosyltransferase